MSNQPTNQVLCLFHVMSPFHAQVWECGIGPGLKHRVKDNFLQWQYKSSDGAPMTFGLRLKTAQLAQQVWYTSFELS